MLDAEREDPVLHFLVAPDTGSLPVTLAGNTAGGNSESFVYDNARRAIRLHPESVKLKFKMPHLTSTLLPLTTGRRNGLLGIFCLGQSFEIQRQPKLN